MKVVIIGGSFGGLSLAYKLERLLPSKKCDITLISKDRRFVFIPSLPWLAMGIKTMEQISFDLEGPLTRKGVRFVNDTVRQIDTGSQKVLSNDAEYGYDYLVNAEIINSTTTTIKQTRNGWNWRKKAEVSMHIKDNKIELMIPRSVLGLQDKSGLSFDFHWADNIQKEDDITEFAISGDSAPNRRFNYRFRE